MFLRVSHLPHPQKKESFSLVFLYFIFLGQGRYKIGFKIPICMHVTNTSTLHEFPFDSFLFFWVVSCSTSDFRFPSLSWFLISLILSLLFFLSLSLLFCLLTLCFWHMDRKSHCFSQLLILFFVCSLFALWRLKPLWGFIKTQN